MAEAQLTQKGARRNPFQSDIMFVERSERGWCCGRIIIDPRPAALAHEWAPKSGSLLNVRKRRDLYVGIVGARLGGGVRRKGRAVILALCRPDDDACVLVTRGETPR